MNIEKYNKVANSHQPQKHILNHTLMAFFSGGIIGIIGELILCFYQYIFDISLKEATPLMIITMVLIASILTGLGIYDRLGAKCGAGTFIPITGFANAMTSSAMEGKSEGLVTGIGANIFKLGGYVIMFGIVSSFILGGIRYVIGYFW